jgi:glycosyltransferase involved in cell wall biosynthesis
MKILLIPIERPAPGVRTGDWHAAIWHLLSRKHDVTGVERPRWHSTAGTSRGVGIAIYNWARAFVYGLGHVGEYDVIYCINTPSAVVGLALHRLTGKPFIWDAGNPSLFNPGRGQRLAFAMERLIADHASGIRMISAHYLDAYAKQGFDKGKMVAIPHLVDLDSIDRVRPLTDIGSFLLFMGQGNTPSNVQALMWLDKSLANLLDKPIVVSGMGVDGCNHLAFVGYVPDIYEYVKSAAVGLVPIWKEWNAPVPSTRTFDFLACSRPVVVTDYILEAIPELRDCENAYVARTKLDFVQRVRFALENPEAAEKVGEEGRRLVREKYSWQSGIPKLEALLKLATG